MSVVMRDEAVVLMRLDYSESSEVLVFFTREYGKVRAIGKGVKRSTKARFATGIDLLEVGSVVFSAREDRGAGLANLTEWKQTRSLFGLRQSLERLNAAEYAVEVTAHLTEDRDPHPELFDALLAALNALSSGEKWLGESDNNPLPSPGRGQGGGVLIEALGSVVRFQFALLDAIGMMPRFDACVQCGRGDPLTHFAPHEGGTICRDCEGMQAEKRELSSRTLAACRLQDPDSAPIETFVLLDYHIAHLMGREPRLSPRLVPITRRRSVR